MRIFSSTSGCRRRSIGGSPVITAVTRAAHARAWICRCRWLSRPSTAVRRGSRFRRVVLLLHGAMGGQSVPGRHLRLAVRAVAEGVLPGRAAAAGRAGVRVAAPELDRAERVVLLAAA